MHTHAAKNKSPEQQLQSLKLQLLALEKSYAKAILENKPQVYLFKLGNKIKSIKQKIAVANNYMFLAR